MRSTFRILFYVKKNAPLRNGEFPIMGRITIDGRRVQFSTRLSVPPGLWETVAGKAGGRSAAANRINDRLAHIRFRMEQCYESVFAERKYVTPQAVKARFFGTDLDCINLLAFFRRHNDEFARMVGISRSRSSYYKYRCVYTHLAAFIRQRYQCEDLTFRELDRSFLVGFHAWIRKEPTLRTNTAWVYMTALKHILMLARGHGYIQRDLFVNYKLHSESVIRNYLTEEELLEIMHVPLDEPELQLVRDAYVFSCFTGLSYIDVCELHPEHLRHERDELWLRTKRHKTGTTIDIRLFAVPQAILLRYGQHSHNERFFKLPSNGWCNACLKRIVDRTHIGRRITFHSARHTFATTITLSQGMAIETISKLLGHTNIRTTQIYATITRGRLTSELDRLSQRLDTFCQAVVS